MRSLKDIEVEQRGHRLSWYETAERLQFIRDNKLFLSEFPYFVQYIKARQSLWGMTWSSVSGFLSAYAIALKLPSELPFPELESHVRPLLQFSKRSDNIALYQSVWYQAHELAESIATDISQRVVVQACSQVVGRSFRLDVDNPSPFLSQTSTKWHSSEMYLALVIRVLIVIDCDPCTDAVAQLGIQARIHFTKENCGLCPRNAWGTVARPSKVHLNIPGGVSSSYSLYPNSSDKCYSMQGRFLIRAIEELRKGTVSEVVAHVKCAVGYQWFHKLAFLFPLCFLAKRIEFDNPDRDASTGSSPHGSAVIYMGPNVTRFVAIFGKHGQIILPTSEAGVSRASSSMLTRWGGRRKRSARVRRVTTVIAPR